MDQEPETTPQEVSPLEAQLYQVVEIWWTEVLMNISPQVPTAIHNQLHELKEGLRARLVDLIHKEH